MPFSLSLFGPIVASVDGRVLPVRGVIPRAAIARLALSAGEVLTADELISALWDAPPPTVLSSLRAHLSRLRSSGWADLIGGGRGGYSLEAPPRTIDLLDYRALVAGGDDDPRDVQLVAAERLWRGAPLVGLGDFPFAAPVIATLAELRRTATHELARIRLDRGEHALVSLALAPLLHDDPDDEQSVALNAEALARSGRTGEALDAIDEFRARMVEQHGLDPSDALALLRQSIVRQDPVVVASGLDDAVPVERFGVPIPLTRFVGRARELDVVETGRAESRLVTLVGPAGVGKTRLAIEVARRATSAVDDRQWLVDLAVVGDASRVLAAVADAVGSTEHRIEPIAERLRGGRALLVLDNAEHVLGTVAALANDLLSRCAGLTVLVTSREALRLAGERVVPIEPFVGASAPDAVRLFVQRATDSAGAPDWNDAELATVARLCAALDGLPLALELAAARLDVLTLAEVAESLRQDAGVTAGTLAGRHDSVDAAIAWSIALLSDTELAALRQLALFAGSFALDAVAAICRVEGADVREVAVALARKSLISVVASETGTRRFRLLESVRAHVRARHREQAADAAAWAERHRDWLVTLVAGTGLALRGTEARRARAVFHETRPDLEIALDRAIEAGDRAMALRLAAPQSWYWYERGLLADGRSALERSLALPGESVPDAEAEAYRTLAFITTVGPDPRETVDAVRHLRDAASRGTSADLRLVAASMQAYLHAVDGDATQADACLDEAAAIRDDPDTALADWARGDELVLRGDTLRALGRQAQALDVMAETYRVGIETGNVFAIKGSCYVTGKALVDVRRAKDALPVLRTGAVRSLEADDVPSALSMLSVYASALVQLERQHDAVTIYTAVDAIGARYGFSPAGVDNGYNLRAQDAARAALALDEQVAAAERGMGMTLQQVMQLAMS